VRTGREEEKFEKRENNFVTAKKKKFHCKKILFTAKNSTHFIDKFHGIEKSKSNIFRRRNMYVIGIVRVL
jgi:hypothetical protein